LLQLLFFLRAIQGLAVTIYAIGGNENAARLSGININKVKVVVYTIAGALAAVGGIMVTARLDSAQPKCGHQL
jgi:ribose transport system permease protein